MGWRQAGGTHSGPVEGSGGKLIEALRWSFDHYDQWRAAKDKADEEGGDVPEEHQPPDIMDGYGGWYEDFWELSTERQIGMGIGPIPASAIRLHVAGWSEEDAEVFEFCMRRMDEVYLMKSNKTDDAPAEPALSAREAFRDAFAGKLKG